MYSVDTGGGRPCTETPLDTAAIGTVQSVLLCQEQEEPSALPFIQSQSVTLMGVNITELPHAESGNIDM